MTAKGKAMRGSFLATCVAAIVLGTFVLPVDGSIILDDFTGTVDITAVLDVPEVNVAGVPVAGVLGAFTGRTSTVSVSEASSSSYENNLIMQWYGDKGYLSMSSESDVAGGFLLDYTVTEGSGLNLNGNAFEFEVAGNDQGGTFSLFLDDGANTGSDSLVVGMSETGIKSIGLIGNTEFAGVDLTSIDHVRFEFQGNPGTDITLAGGLIVTTGGEVPEPASVTILSLLILGFVAVGYYRTRVKK